MPCSRYNGDAVPTDGFAVHRIVLIAEFAWKDNILDAWGEVVCQALTDLNTETKSLTREIQEHIDRYYPDDVLKPQQRLILETILQEVWS